MKKCPGWTGVEVEEGLRSLKHSNTFLSCVHLLDCGYQAAFSLIKQVGTRNAIILCIISGAKRQFSLYDFCG